MRQIQPSDINDIIEISFYDAIQATTPQDAIEMQAKINQDYIDGITSIPWTRFYDFRYVLSHRFRDK